jgi:hypothetical protein
LTGVGTTIDEYIIGFYMRVQFEITNKNTGTHIRYAQYSGRGSAKLKVTNGKFKIIIVPTDNFAGRSCHRLGVGETATISVESIPTGSTVTIVPGTSTEPNPSGTGRISVSGTSITAGDFVGNGTVKVKAKVNGTVTTETLQLIAVEPLGVRFEEYVPFRNKIPSSTRMVPLSPNERGTMMYNKMFLNPTDVSFSSISVGEDAIAPTEYNGTLIIYNPDGTKNDGKHVSWSQNVGDGNLISGCRIGGNFSVEPSGTDMAGFRQKISQVMVFLFGTSPIHIKRKVW